MHAARADVLIRITCALALHALLWTILLSPGDGLAADLQKRRVRIGFVGPESQATTVSGVAAFWQRLSELGWVDGQNVAVEARWTEGHSDRLPKTFAEIVQRQLDVLVTYSTPAAVAAKTASSTVPIVVAGMADPVGSKLAASLAKPGANLTGLSLGYSEGFSGKWLEMLRETVPQLSTVGIIWNPTNPADIVLRRKTAAAAAAAGVKLQFIDLRTPDGIEEAFRKARQVAQAIVVFPTRSP